MPFPLAAAIGGGLALGGGIISAFGQNSTNKANAKQAQRQMDFQERMSGSSYQRGVEDMRKAGLNPALAYEKGGASSPTGAAAEMTNTLAGAGGTARSAADTYTQIAATRAQMEQQHSQAELLKAQANQLRIESMDRLLQVRSNARLTSLDADFARDSFTPRLTFEAAKGMREEQTQRFESDKFDRERREMWPLMIQKLKQDILASFAGTRDTEAAARLKELNIPAASNAADAARTLFGRKVKPYLGDAASLLRLIQAVKP